MNNQNGQGHVWPVDPSKRLMTAEQWRQVGLAAQLTPREQRVCELLFGGLTRHEIAESLQIKPRTVRQHLEHLHHKLNVRSRVGVVLRVIQLRDGLGSQHGPDQNGQVRARTSDVEDPPQNCS